MTLMADTLTVDNFMKNAHAQRSVSVGEDGQIQVDGTISHTITVCGLHFTFSPGDDVNDTQEYQGGNENEAGELDEDENQTQHLDVEVAGDALESNSHKCDARHGKRGPPNGRLSSRTSAKRRGTAAISLHHNPTTTPTATAERVEQLLRQDKPGAATALLNEEANAI
eukprot:gene2047-29554_t